MRPKPKQTNKRGAMKALSIDQHKGVMRVEAAQCRGADEGCAVRNGKSAQEEGRHDLGNHIEKVGGIDAFNDFGTKEVHGNRGVNGSSRAVARAYGDYLLDDSVRRGMVVQVLIFGTRLRSERVGNHRTSTRRPRTNHLVRFKAPDGLDRSANTANTGMSPAHYQVMRRKTPSLPRHSS